MKKQLTIASLFLLSTNLMASNYRVGGTTLDNFSVGSIVIGKKLPSSHIQNEEITKAFTPSLGKCFEMVDAKIANEGNRKIARSISQALDRLSYNDEFQTKLDRLEKPQEKSYSLYVPSKKFKKVEVEYDAFPYRVPQKLEVKYHTYPYSKLMLHQPLKMLMKVFFESDSKKVVGIDYIVFYNASLDKAVSAIEKRFGKPKFKVKEGNYEYFLYQSNITDPAHFNGSIDIDTKLRRNEVKDKFFYISAEKLQDSTLTTKVRYSAFKDINNVYSTSNANLKICLKAIEPFIKNDTLKL
ncbi:hypothetical protein [Vibrio natriegens]|uniref:hypothetical protein n=1 Tax=Vibrio natriegens TaxID=691 RepID=UPI0008046811|nr:hypothetical protein [Vibrio natriegens]ANQ19621.1 hypothetical protein BA891_20895 [Vibrio natriegens]